MILIAIAVAEVLFWVLLVAGLLTRYALRAPRVGAALLIATPIVDLVLLALTYIDLSSTHSSNFAHGLSALYIGYSITLGPTIIRAMDVRFARRFGTPDNNTTNADMRTTESAMTTWKRACRLPDQYCLARGRHCGYRITGLILVDLLGIRRRIYRADVVVYRPASREKEETRQKHETG